MRNYSPSRQMFSVNPNFVEHMKNRSSIVFLIATGFFSILSQVILIRELNVAFYGIELIYVLSFSFWLFGTTIGAAAGRRSYIPGEITIQIFFLLSAILLIADIVFIRGIRNIFGGVPGGYLPFLYQIAGLIIALLPIGFLSGLLFQWTAKRFIEIGQTLAKAYAIESAGGVLGAFVSIVVLTFGVNNFSTGIICGLVLISLVIFFSFRSSQKIIKVISSFLVFAFLTLLVLSNQIDLLMTSWNHSDLVESLDTPYSRITITSPEKQICVFEDDVLSYETQSVEAEEFVQMATLQQSKLGNILVLGGGFAGTISELLKLSIKKIDYIEINQNLIKVIQKYLPPDLSNALKNKKVNIIYDDPRKFLQKTHSYDLILAGMPEPMSAQTNRFYTKEFFEQCANSLNDKGILAFKIQSSENIWTDQLIRRNAGIYYAVKSAFDSVVVLPGVVNIFIAAKSKLTTDTELLINRFRERNTETKLVSPQYIHYIYTNDRFREIQDLISGRNKNINSDLRPVCYSYTISLWLTKFFPGLAYSENLLPLTPDKALHSIWLYILIILLIGVFFFSRKSKAVKRFTLVFAAGFTGMVLEIILILLYQNKNGILFRDIGLLIMAFMGGLSLGSFFINIFFMKSDRKGTSNFLGNLLFIGLALFILLIYFLIRSDLISSFLVISMGLLIDGMFVSGVFAFASLNQIDNQQIVIRQLYTADLIGGCAGSFIASLVLIPVYGFLAALLLLMVIAAGSLIVSRI